MRQTESNHAAAVPSSPDEPGHDCRLCPRLAEFRDANRAGYPGFFNGPVPSFGDATARMLVVGLAPGLKGANRTGRPFTGDYAGDLLYATLITHGFAEGIYAQRPDDGLALTDCRITNAVRCVPPANKPVPQEIKTCRGFLSATIAAMPRLVAVVALGRIAHDSLIPALGGRRAAHPFGHGAVHTIGPLTVFDSYHCSRYNTNTGVLTAAMFDAVFAAARQHVDAAQPLQLKTISATA